MNDVSPTASPEQRHRLLKWKRDIILATSPATTGNSEDMPLHLIVLAMLGLHKHMPRLSKGCIINKDGSFAAVMFTSKTGREPVLLGQGEHIMAALNRLADHCKLSDPDRIAMFLALKNWVHHDDRANDPHKERVN